MMNERKASIGAEDRVFKKREEAKISDDKNKENNREGKVQTS